MTQTSTSQSLTPQEAAALQKAHAALQNGKAAEADRICHGILAKKPRQPSALTILALAKISAGDFKSAEQFSRQALAVMPGPAAARGEILNVLGNALAGLDRSDEACSTYRQAIDLLPGQPEFWFNLGRCLLTADRAEEAEGALRQALSLNPRDVRFVSLHALALKNLNRWQDAAALYRGLLATSPDSPQLHYDLGECLFQLGDMTAAAEAFARAAELKPDFIIAHEALANVNVMTGRKDETLASYQSAMVAIQSLDLRLSYATTLLRMDRHDDAEQVLLDARRAFAPTAQIEYSLGRLRVMQNRFAEAMPFYETAIRLMPHEPALLIQLARAQLGAGDPKAAAANLEQAVTRVPKSQLAYAHLGLAYRLLGDGREYELNSYEEFIREYTLSPPEGFPDPEAFNAALDQALDTLHGHAHEPLDQTLRGGTQTMGPLFSRQLEAVQAARRAIELAVSDYVSSMSGGDDHPLLRQRKNAFRFSGSWSCRLRSAGFHTNHIHPEGWISSAYYVALPDAVTTSSAQEGWIKFGQPDLPTLDLAPRRIIKPSVGKLVLFPSYMFHGTVPFADTKHRTTIAFDVVPA